MTSVFKCFRPVATVGLSLGLLALATPSAYATVQFNIQVLGGTNGPYVDSFSQPGVATGFPQVFNYQGNLSDPFGEWAIQNWDFNADRNPDGSGAEVGARIGSVFTVQNLRPDGPTAADNHLRFSILVTIDLTHLATATTITGNGSLTLTIDQSPNGFPGEIAAIGSSIWNYRLNGVDVADLLQDGFVLGGTNGPATASTGMHSLTAGQTGPLLGTVVSSMGIRLDFDLSPGERATFNGLFRVIPTPGCLALLGLACVMRNSRRRS